MSPPPADQGGSGAGAAAADRRADRRLRTRLRPAKLYGEDGRFIADCMMENRSESGARLAFFGDVPAPGEAFLFDESLGTLVRVSLAWRSRQVAGVRFAGRPMRLGPLARDRLGGRYYAVGN